MKSLYFFVCCALTVSFTASAGPLVKATHEAEQQALIRADYQIAKQKGLIPASSEVLDATPVLTESKAGEMIRAKIQAFKATQHNETPAYRTQGSLSTEIEIYEASDDYTELARKIRLTQEIAALIAKAQPESLEKQQIYRTAGVFEENLEKMGNVLTFASFNAVLIILNYYLIRYAMMPARSTAGEIGFGILLGDIIAGYLGNLGLANAASNDRLSPFWAAIGNFIDRALLISFQVAKLPVTPLQRIFQKSPAARLLELTIEKLDTSGLIVNSAAIPAFQQNLKKLAAAPSHIECQQLLLESASLIEAPKAKEGR